MATQRTGISIDEDEPETQVSTEVSESAGLFDGVEQSSDLRNLHFRQAKIRKWGRMVMYTGYMLVLYNVIALFLIMFNSKSNYFTVDDDRGSRKRLEKYMREVNDRKDLSEEEKFLLD